MNLKGEGRNLKPSVFSPKSSEEQKKGGHHTLRLFFIYRFYTTKVLCICLRGGAPPGYAPEYIKLMAFARRH